VLFQNFAQYWFTARENIGIGNILEIQNTEKIKQAAAKSGADIMIEALPQTYENLLSPAFEGGIDLSGGQWQMIGIARGMFADPKLIVLDEPTSALDALAEAKVFEEIEHIAEGTTMFIVSHRFATVRNADRIFVLEQGHVTEQGSHQELMAMKGLYHKMFTTQAEGYK
jgi:ATP-binding cassette subfamily B protein